MQEEKQFGGTPVVNEKNESSQQITLKQTRNKSKQAMARMFPTKEEKRPGINQQQSKQVNSRQTIKQNEKFTKLIAKHTWNHIARVPVYNNNLRRKQGPKKGRKQNGKSRKAGKQNARKFAMKRQESREYAVKI